MIAETILSLCALCASPRTEARDTVSVTAYVESYRLERDGDIHLILSDSGCTMIAEIEPGSALRQMFPHRKGRVGKTMTLVGIRYYDRLHNVKGQAPNGVELHPVFRIEAR